MADSYDNNDCYTPQEWHEATPSVGKRFLYFKVNYVKITEGEIDRQEHYINREERNRAYRVKIDWQKCFWTNTPQDNVSIAILGNGYWTEEFHYDPDYDSSLSAVLFVNPGAGYVCNSSIGTGNISTGSWTGLEGYDCCIIGPLTRTRDANGAVTLVSGGDVTVLRKNRSTGVVSEYWADTDNDKDGTHSGGAHVTETYYVTAIIYDVDNNSEVPDIFEAAIPTDHAWYRTSDPDWIELGSNPLTNQVTYNQELRNLASWYMDDHGEIKANIVPHMLEWAYPYPYGKWYREDEWITNRGLPKFLSWSQPYPYGKWYRENGVFKTRGMPDPLINDLGAFSGCTNLTRVDIPETVETIGRYSFYQTALTEVTLPDNCTYYATSFPEDCVVTGGQLLDEI